jgi:hypothetical protein
VYRLLATGTLEEMVYRRQVGGARGWGADGWNVVVGGGKEGWLVCCEG